VAFALDAKLLHPRPKAMGVEFSTVELDQKRDNDANAIYHALNRGDARSSVFKKDADYDAFEPG